MNELKIEVPQGMVVDMDNSNLANGIIKFKSKEKQLPKTWEEYCETYQITNEDYFLGTGSRINKRNNIDKRYPNSDKNVGTKETCEAVLALMQLIQLRNCYNDGWKPDWSDCKNKFVIWRESGEITVDINTYAQRVLAFKTEELRDTFLNNFRDLIEIAKPLI